MTGDHARMVIRLSSVGLYGKRITVEGDLLSSDEGLAKAVAVLKEATIAEPAGEMFWA
jgi:hypothetical protein